MFGNRGMKSIVVGALALFCMMTLTHKAIAQAPNTSQYAAAMVGPPADNGEAKIRRALTAPATLDFVDTPLADVAASLESAYSIPVELEVAALERVGLSPDAPISRELKDVSLRTALRLMLRDLGLTYVVDEGALVITTREEAAQRLSTRVYPVTPLLPANATDAKELAQLVRETVLRRTSGNGAPAIISTYGPLLIVRDTEEGHDEVEKFLSDLANGLNAALQQPSPMSGP